MYGTEPHQKQTEQGTAGQLIAKYSRIQRQRTTAEQQFPKSSVVHNEKVCVSKFDLLAARAKKIGSLVSNGVKYFVVCTRNIVDGGCECNYNTNCIIYMHDENGGGRAEEDVGTCKTGEERRKADRELIADTTYSA